MLPEKALLVEWPPIQDFLDSKCCHDIGHAPYIKQNTQSDLADIETAR